MEELEPKTENGNLLNTLLKNWIVKFPHVVQDKFERILILYAFKIKNDDAFIAALYGQNVGDETPLNLRQNLTTNLLRLQHAIENACGKKHVKEIVVALEWSENDEILAEILKWAQSSLHKYLEEQTPVDLAPMRVKKADIPSSRPSRNSVTLAGQVKHMAEAVSTMSIRTPAPDLRKRRPFSSVFVECSADFAEQRDREIVFDSKTKLPAVVEACGNKIIIGLAQGPVLLYNSLDLKCEKTLSHCKITSTVTCLQCTCVEIIVGYADANICVWNIQNESLVRKFFGGSLADHGGHAVSLRLSEPMFVAAGGDCLVRVWKFEGAASVTPICEWNPGVGYLEKIDIYRNSIVLLNSITADVRIYGFTGALLQVISLSSGSNDMALHNGHLITGGRGKIIEIWSVTTGQHLKALPKHGWRIASLSARDNFLLSQEDNCGRIVIWSIEAALKNVPAARMRIEGPPGFHMPSLGQDFFVRKKKDGATILVTDFP